MRRNRRLGWKRRWENIPVAFREKPSIPVAASEPDYPDDRGTGLHQFHFALPLTEINRLPPWPVHLPDTKSRSSSGNWLFEAVR